MADELKVIGKPGNLDKQSYAIVTGKLDFSADHLFPGKLFARILGSPHTNARVKSVDTSQAEALPGVMATCTYKDCPIMVEKISHWGQEVAAVAAVDPNTAARALELIKVEYEVLPFVVDPDESYKAGAPAVGSWPEGNVTAETPMNRGDADAGFAQANAIVEDTIGWTTYFQHQNIEPRSSVAYWVGDQLYMWTCSQNPGAHRNMIRTVLKIPENKIHFVSHGTGVAHGDKTTQEQCLISAVLSKKAGRPVEMHLSRKEHMTCARHQYRGKGTFKLGAKSDGTLVAMDATMYADVGSDVDPPSRTRAAGFHPQYREQYKCANVRNKNYNIATNKPRTGYYRCVGDQTGAFLTEIMMEQMANKLNMNPLDFRLKNLITSDTPHQDNGRPYSAVSLKECLQAVATASGWSQKWHAPGTKTLPDGRLHGIGMAVVNVLKGGIMMGPNVGAIIHMTRDGKALCNFGIARASGSTNSAMCHIVAEVLTLPYDDVMTGDWGNLDVAAEGGGQNGSTRSITVGAAFQRAAEDLRSQILEAAVAQLGVQSSSQLELKNGAVYVIADQSKTRKISEICTLNAWPFVGRGYPWAQVLQRPVPGFEVGKPAEVRTHDAMAVELAIDQETGEIEVLMHCNADDCGRVLFRDGAEGQIEGGTMMAFGQAMLYEQIFDPGTGATLNPDFLDNKNPTFLDWDDSRINTQLLELIDAVGPFGARGLGEPVLAAYVAFNNAVFNATGKWIKTGPLYPWKILQALGKV